MRILFVVEHFYPYIGGAEELFLGLTTSLVAHGNDVTVVTTLHDNSLPATENYRGVKIQRVRCYNRFLFTLASLPAVIKYGRKSDIIHTTSYNAALPAAIAATFLRKKAIITFHEVWGRLWFKLPFTPKWVLALYYWYEKIILNLPFQQYVAVSQSTAQSLIGAGIPANKISRIYNGMEYTQLAGYHHHPPTDFVFCFFGRLGISKGLDILLPAARVFTERHPETRLKLIIPTYPSGIYRKVKNKIRELGLEKSIQLLHDLEKSQLMKEISTSSCVVIPSYSEGFCYTAVESVAMGVPVISSGTGSLPEVTGGNHLTMRGQTPEALVACLEKAYAGQWEYSTPVKFTLQQSLEGYLELYEKLKR